MSDTAFKALWREQLSLGFHPSMRREATLISLVKRLDTVTNFLARLSDEGERAGVNEASLLQSWRWTMRL